MAHRIRAHRHGGPEVLEYESYDVPEPGPGEAVDDLGGRVAAAAHGGGELVDGARAREAGDQLPVLAEEGDLGGAVGQGPDRAHPRRGGRHQVAHLVDVAHPAADLVDDGLDVEPAVRADPVHRVGLEVEPTVALAEQRDQRVVHDRQHDRGQHVGIDAAVGEFVMPSSLTMDVGEMLMGDNIKREVSAVGVVVVFIHSATDLEKQDLRGSSDPYCTLSLAKVGKILYSTRVVLNELSPRWER